MAPAVRTHPEARPPGSEVLMAVKILADQRRDERRRTILREAEERYRHELLPDEERMLLQDRIERLRRTLGMMVG